jgi:hypothetical protein
MTKTWIAAVVAAVLLLGGGLGGYVIGAANDHHDGRPGWHERAWPGGPEGFRDAPRWRDGPDSGGR